MSKLDNKLEELQQDMRNNIESMIGEFGIDNIHPVSTTEQYTWSEVDKSDKQFCGITIYPVHLFDAINHMETIIEEGDCDTCSAIVDDFTYTITPNMLLTRTNHQIMDEVKAMLEAYNASIIPFIYNSKGVFKQSLTFDYDKEVYLLQHDDLEPVIANEDFQCVNNIQYEHTTKNKKFRWWKIANTKETPTTPVSISDMVGVISHNAQFEDDSDLLDTMNNIIEWLSGFNDFYRAYWDEDDKDFVVVDPNGEEESYLGMR